MRETNKKWVRDYKQAKILSDRPTLIFFRIATFSHGASVSGLRFPHKDILSQSTFDGTHVTRFFTVFFRQMPWYSTSHADNGLEVAVHCRVVNRRNKNGVGDIMRIRPQRSGGRGSTGTAVVRY
jgi:hypothetical protein